MMLVIRKPEMLLVHLASQNTHEVGLFKFIKKKKKFPSLLHHPCSKMEEQYVEKGHPRWGGGGVH